MERRPPRLCAARGSLLGGLVALSLLVSWNPVITDCQGFAIMTPVDHYELQIFEARIIGSMGGAPIYAKSTVHTTTATSIDLDPKVGEVVGWDGMWSSTWTLQNPTVVTVTESGNRSSQPCP